MDSVFGDCWKCQQPSKGIKCEKCLVAEYCRPECRFKHRFIHEPFCNGVVALSTCLNCKSKSDGLKTCSGCYSATYCNSDCQRKHWSHHKTECKTYRDTIIQQSKKITIDCYAEFPWYIGSSFAEDYLNITKNEGTSWIHTLRILLVGVGDIKDVVRTLIDLPEDFMGKTEFVLNDFSPHSMARNMLFLYLVLMKKEFKHLVQIWNSLLLTADCLEFLKMTLETLITEKTNVLNALEGILEISDSNWEDCIDIWRGWLKMAKDPKALRKVIEYRQKKLEKDSKIKTYFEIYFDLLPRFHLKSVKVFIKDFIFQPLKSSERLKAIHGNPTFLCFNPLKPEHINKYSDINEDQTYVMTEDNLSSIQSDNLMIMSFKAINSVLMTWDYLEVKKQVVLSSDIIQMYGTYLEQIYQKFSFYVLKGTSHFRLIVDRFQELDNYLSVDEKFDRIGTSSLSDQYTTCAREKIFTSFE